MNRRRQFWHYAAKELPFTDTAIGPVRVVVAEEAWDQRQRVAGRKTVQRCQSPWCWLATREWDGYGPQVVWRIGHQRWGVENHAFNELTRHYHLEHCPHHEPTAILAWLLILVLALNLFEVLVRRQGKLWRQGRLSLQEAARQLDRALEHVEALEPLWSGGAGSRGTGAFFERREETALEETPRRRCRHLPARRRPATGLPPPCKPRPSRIQRAGDSNMRNLCRRRFQHCQASPNRAT